MLTIRQIHPKDFPFGKKVFYTYTSQKYYQLHSEKAENGWSFSLKEETFETPFVKELEEEIFEPYKEGSEVYLAEWDGEEAAIMVIQEMEWNHTLLIHDLYVQSRFQRLGIGNSLIEAAKKRADELSVRSIMLETQTSNYPAVQFYLRNDFDMIGFNTISYSNDDVKNKEVRIEMAYLPEDHKIDLTECKK